MKHHILLIAAAVFIQALPDHVSLEENIQFLKTQRAPISDTEWKTLTEKPIKPLQNAILKYSKKEKIYYLPAYIADTAQQHVTVITLNTFDHTQKEVHLKPYPPQPEQGILDDKLLNQAQAGNTQAAEIFLKAGANIEAKEDPSNFASNTPLILAAQFGHLKTVQLLIKYGAIINPSEKSFTPLMRASLANTNSDIVKELLNNRANVNAQNSPGWTALHYAAYNKTTEVIDALLGAHPNVTLQDDEGNTPLIKAIEQKNAYLAQKIIETSDKNVIDIKNKKGDSALLIAAQDLQFDPDLLEALLNNSKPKNIDIKNAQNKTPLEVAIEKSNPIAIELLVKYGANTELQDSKGDTLLLQAIKQKKQPSAQQLMTKANVNATDSSGNTALMLSIQKFDSSFITTLLNTNRINNIDAKNNEGHTALYYAIEKFNPNIITALIVNNARVTQDDLYHANQTAQKLSQILSSMRKKIEQDRVKIEKLLNQALQQQNN